MMAAGGGGRGREVDDKGVEVEFKLGEGGNGKVIELEGCNCEKEGMGGVVVGRGRWGGKSGRFGLRLLAWRRSETRCECGREER
jgi:hypothetical protein